VISFLTYPSKQAHVLFSGSLETFRQGFILHQVFPQGQIVDPLDDSEWSILWDAYHEQKEALGLEGSAQSSSAGS
jgi:hypothetical protein